MHSQKRHWQWLHTLPPSTEQTKKIFVLINSRARAQPAYIYTDGLLVSTHRAGTHSISHRNIRYSFICQHFCETTVKKKYSSSAVSGGGNAVARPSFPREQLLLRANCGIREGTAGLWNAFYFEHKSPTYYLHTNGLFDNGVYTAAAYALPLKLSCHTPAQSTGTFLPFFQFSFIRSVATFSFFYFFTSSSTRFCRCACQRKMNFNCRKMKYCVKRKATEGIMNG